MRTALTAGAATAVLLGSSLVAAPALAATGSVSGRITSADTGHGLRDALVVAFPGHVAHAAATARTAADGTYSLDALDTSISYTICVDAVDDPAPDPNGLGYQSRCYLDVSWDADYDAPVPSDAQAVPVGSTGVDIALPRGGVISGQVVDATDGSPVRHVRVEIFSDPAPANFHWLAVGYTAADGTYRLRGLPSSSGLLVCFEAWQAHGDAATGYRPQCHRGRLWGGLFSRIPAGTSPVPVTGGSVTSGVDEPMRRAAAVRGRVTDERDGTPLADVNVYGFDADGNTVFESVTAKNGTYRSAPLVAAHSPLIICFAADQFTHYPGAPTGYAGECYANRPWDGREPDLGGTLPPGTTSVALMSGQFASASARLAPAGRVVGVVRSQSGDPVPDEFVEAFDATGRRVVATDSGADGRFVLPGLLPGNDYRVCADDTRNHPTYAAVCYRAAPWAGGGSPLPSGATAISIVSGETVHAPITVPPA